MAGRCGSLDCDDPRSRVDSHAWTRVNEGCPGPPICCDPDQEDLVLFWAALVLWIFLCRACSFQPPPSRLGKSLAALSGELGVIRPSEMEAFVNTGRQGRTNPRSGGQCPGGRLTAQHRYWFQGARFWPVPIGRPTAT